MKFGQSANPELIDFRLPADSSKTAEILEYNDQNKPMNIYVGCAKWNKTDVNFFVHQNIELESHFLSAYFIERLNKEFD
ncbi:MAG TPA: hypothetical protein DCR40_21205 [Prolixibacteraceae bacterium]|nr:hypothetical protein [Prolixibacteraceae bacterium]